MLSRVSEQANESPQRWAAAVVCRFAEATNLSIAGHRFSVHGTGQHALALERMLVAIGARGVRSGEAPDYLFCTGEGVPALTRDGLAPTIEDRDDRRPLLIVDAASVPAAVDDGSFGPLHELRDGLFQTALPGIVVVKLRGQTWDEHDGNAVSRIQWARRFMPITEGIASQLGTMNIVRGVRVGLSMVLEPKTAVLALALRDAGAEVTVFSHPDETDETVAAVLRDAGLRTYADAAAGPREHRELAMAFLAGRPQVLIDDGSHLIRLAHEARPEVLTDMIGAAEETTSGLRPLRRMAEQDVLRIPVIAVNDARSKTLFDNRYGTGQSCLFAILALTEMDLAACTVAVVGYGHVGEGVAHHVRALGGTVVVAEVDPVRALQAVFDGYRVASLIDAVRDAGLVISATGAPDTIGLPILLACARDAVIAVAGGVDQEIAIDDALAAGAVRETIGRKIERFTFPVGSSVVILDDGGCINVTAAEGNPIEIMDLSFAVQLSAIRFLVESAGSLPVGVHPLPREADDAVAASALTSAGIAVDVGPSRGEDVWLSPRFDDGVPS